MISIQRCTPAFAQLELVDKKLAFEIVGRVDMLMTFPEMGTSLESLRRSLKGCQQLVVGRNHRVVYEYDRESEEIWILAVQHCHLRSMDRQDCRPERGLVLRRSH